MGFFVWIREGVRRAVLLGFSDALEQLGTPDETSELNPRLLAALGPSTRPAVEQSKPAVPVDRNARKRLGKSFDQIRADVGKAA
ncbi:MAG: hypothetical protein ACYC35_04765 [Pirellulales bacterium]